MDVFASFDFATAGDQFSVSAIATSQNVHTILTAQPPVQSLATPHGTITSAMQTALQRRGPSRLSAKQLSMFDDHVYTDLQSYTSKMKQLCANFQDQSWSYDIVQFIEPLQSTLKTWIGYAAGAAQAAPVPVAPVLGGIMCIMDVTQRYSRYQERIAKMLATMGQKASVLVEYEQDIYRDDPAIQEALICIYVDIIDFNERCMDLMVNKKGEIRRNVKLWRLSVYKDFDFHLGPYVTKFQDDINKFEDLALLRDRRQQRDVQLETELAGRRGIAIWASLTSTIRQVSQNVQDLLIQNNEWERERSERKRQRAKEKIKEYTRGKVLNWLSALNYKRDFDESCASHLAGTGEWFLQSDRYKDWRSLEASDLLWVTGKPGCGKSVLAALTVADLAVLKTPRVAVAYVFCKGPVNKPRDSLTLLRGLLSQFCYQSARVEETALELHEDIYNNQDPVLGTVLAAMTAIFAHFSHVYLIVDGLDECTDHKVLADFLKESVKSATTTMKIIVFSRPSHEHIRSAFVSFSRALEVDSGANNEDIKAFINDKVSLSNLKLQGNEEYLNEIKEKLLSKADGMFLWVQLLVSTLEEKKTIKQIKDTIEKVPPLLSGTYNLCLERIWKQESAREYAFKALLWVLNAMRELTEREIIEAVSTEPRKKALDEESMIGPGDLLEMCGDLLRLNSEHRVIFVHPSLQEYLKEPQESPGAPFKNFSDLQERAHCTIAELCLTYLLFDVFSSGPKSSVEELEKLKENNALYPYASLYWAKHADISSNPPTDLITDLLHSGEHQRLAMQQSFHFLKGDFRQFAKSTPLHFLALYDLRSITLTHPEFLSDQSTVDSEECLPLDYALACGSESMTLLLLANSAKAETSGPPKLGEHSPIHVAIHRDWPEVLNLALSRGFDTEKRTGDGALPIVLAAELGKSHFILKLLEARAEPNVKDSYGDTVLIVAIENGIFDVIDPLLKAGADVKLLGRDGGTALHSAVYQVDIATVKKILDTGAEVSPRAVGSENHTPLHYACLKGASEIVQILLDRGASTSETSSRGHTPLHMAAFYGCLSVAKALLMAGADVNAVSHSGSTCLHIAAEHGFADFIDWICKYDESKSIDAIDEDNDTPLHLAARLGEADCVRCLLENGAKVDEENCEGRTPLMKAIIGMHSDTVTILLDHGANANKADKLGVTPLMFAAYFGVIDCLEALVYQGKAVVDDVSLTNNSALHYACTAGTAAFVIKLLDICPSICLNGRNKNGMSPLFLAALQGKLDMFTALMAQGATADPDEDNDLPIHVAAMGGHVEILKKLVDESTVNDIGSNGRTPLFFAVANGHLPAVKFLASVKGCGINMQDKSGVSPLLMAVSKEYVEIANLLLDLNANASLTTSDGCTPLHTAAQENELQIAQRLLDAGYDALGKAENGATPFLVATARSNYEMVRLFMDRGFNGVNVDTLFGYTPLMAAASENDKALFEFLIREGANPNDARDVKGHTVGHYAAYGGAVEAFHHLKGQGLDLNIASRTNYTIIAEAASRRFPEMVIDLVKEGVSVDVEDTASGRTPLLYAIAARATKTTRILLTAGADPHHKDRTGRNALDLAGAHEEIVNLLRNSTNSSDCTRHDEQCINYAIPSIKKHLEALLALSDPLNYVDKFTRLEEISNAAFSLAFLSDSEFDDAAVLCYCEKTFASIYDLGEDVTCSICWNDSPEVIHFCRICSSTQFCQPCVESFGYDNRDGGNKSVPEALKELKQIEKSLQQIRHRAQRAMLLGNPLFTLLSLDYFDMIGEWINEKEEEYQKWNESHNSERSFNILGRPGEEFIGLVKDGASLLKTIQEEINITGSITEGSEKRVVALKKKFRNLNRRHPAGQEYQDFVCRGHPLLKISLENWNKAKEDNNIVDTSANLLSREWLNNLSCRISEYQIKPRASKVAEVKSILPLRKMAKISMDRTLQLELNTKLSSGRGPISSPLRNTGVSFDEYGSPIIATRPERTTVLKNIQIKSLRKRHTFPVQFHATQQQKHHTFPVSHVTVNVPRANSLPHGSMSSEASAQAKHTLVTERSFSRITEEEIVNSPVAESLEVNVSEQDGEIEEVRATVGDNVDSLLPNHLILDLSKDKKPQSDPQEQVYKMQDQARTIYDDRHNMEKTLTIKYDADNSSDLLLLSGLTFAQDIDEEFPFKWAMSNLVSSALKHKTTDEHKKLLEWIGTFENGLSHTARSGLA